MAKKRVFISFDFDNDKSLKDLLVGQSRNPDSPFEISDWSLKEEAPEREWEQKALDKIKRSDILLVITGAKTYKASGVKKEVKMARSINIPVIQIKPQDTNNTSVMGAGILYNWTWKNLKNILK